MAYALTAIALVLGLSVFFTKYVVVLGRLESRAKRLLVARLCLCVIAVTVLVAPHDYCAAWAYPLEEAMPSAFVVALVEVYGDACSSKCGIGTSVVALLYALLHASHELDTACGAGFFAATVTGLVLGPVVWLMD